MYLICDTLINYYLLLKSTGKGVEFIVILKDNSMNREIKMSGTIRA